MSGALIDWRRRTEPVVIRECGYGPSFALVDPFNGAHEVFSPLCPYEDSSTVLALEPHATIATHVVGYLPRRPPDPPPAKLANWMVRFRLVSLNL